MQRKVVEAELGDSLRLIDVPELEAIVQGADTLAPVNGVQQLGVGSVQDALVTVAAAEEARKGSPSLLRVNLGPANTNRGIFGAGTERAILELQRQVGLPPTGRIDAHALAALDIELERARAATSPLPPSPSSKVLTHLRFNSIAAFQDVLSGRVILKAGDDGDAVSSLQQALRDMGFPMTVLRNGIGVSGVDGTFGSQTETVLRNFQVHAKTKYTDVRVNGVVDAPTMRALIALAPEPDKRAWDAGQPNHAPTPYWNGGTSKKLTVVVVKDEHRTFLFDTQGRCTGIFPNAHGTARSETDTGLKKVFTKLNETQAKSVGQELWGSERAFGKRIIDLGWASGSSSGEELHGTYEYHTMGKNVSHGCVRHYNEDIVSIFDAVRVGDYVAIVTSIDEPLLRGDLARPS